MKGTYIEDSSKKITRHDIRGQAEALNQRKTLPIHPVAMEGFNRMLMKLANGNGVSFMYDLTGDEDEVETKLQTTVPMTNDSDDEEDDEDEDDSNGGS